MRTAWSPIAHAGFMPVTIGFSPPRRTRPVLSACHRCSGDEPTPSHFLIWLDKPMRAMFAKLLRGVGLLHWDLISGTQPTYPDLEAVRGDELVIVEDAGLLKWACLRCPGGCGTSISLSLNQQRRPRWQARTDFWRRPTVEPSVHQKNDCGCHFWIKGGRIEWCPGGRPKRLGS